MPERYRQLVLSDSLKAISSKDYPVGYWNKKPQCRFPTAVLPPEQQRPWMLKEDGSAKRPFGEVYRTTPGSWYFRTTCFKCHGERADGNTGLARGLLNWSGGSVRVANLIDGLFGNAGKNQKEFEVKDQNLAGNYLIWMAMEGTRVQFPPEASNFIGKHGAQMLNQVREKCLRQISIEKASSPKIPDHEIFREVCFSGNKSPDDPSLQFDPVTTQPRNPAAVEEWLDQAAFNGGWMIFQYLQEASHGTWRLGNSECEKIPGGQP
jgi:hypothetical protein